MNIVWVFTPRLLAKMSDLNSQCHVYGEDIRKQRKLVDDTYEAFNPTITEFFSTFFSQVNFKNLFLNHEFRYSIMTPVRERLAAFINPVIAIYAREDFSLVSSAEDLVQFMPILSPGVRVIAFVVCRGPLFCVYLRFITTVPMIDLNLTYKCEFNTIPLNQVLSYTDYRLIVPHGTIAKYAKYIEFITKVFGDQSQDARNGILKTSDFLTIPHVYDLTKESHWAPVSRVLSELAANDLLDVFH